MSEEKNTLNDLKAKYKELLFHCLDPRDEYEIGKKTTLEMVANDLDSLSLNEWVRCEDRLPEEDCYCLVIAPECHIIGDRLVAHFLKEGTSDKKPSFTVYDFHESDYRTPVTHWMPLPSPPQPK